MSACLLALINTVPCPHRAKPFQQLVQICNWDCLCTCTYFINIFIVNPFLLPVSDVNLYPNATLYKNVLFFVLILM